MIKLTDQQRELVEAQGSLIALACPGAGKTKAMVARFIRRADEEPRRGIALVSFTNAAVDEVRARCASNPRVLTAPNFVGTFDSFINRFVTAPQYIRHRGKLPRFTEHWGNIPFATFRLSYMGKAPSLELEWFDFNSDGTATLVRDRIPQKVANALKDVLDRRMADVVGHAARRFNQLLEAGTVSCSASRTLAQIWSTQPETRAELKRLLAARFAEVIVDEAQDCGTEELHLLELLREADVEVVMVADLDQSIYGFRRATPDKVKEFADDLGEPLVLDGNFRSSPAICSLNRSLRHLRRADEPVGINKTCDLPVLLISYTSLTELAPAVTNVMAGYDMQMSDVMVLAHRTDDARKAAGDEPRSESTNKILGIALARQTLLSPSSRPNERLAAMGMVERLLIATVTESDRDGKTTVLAECETHGISYDWLRSQAVRLVMTLDPLELSAATYAERVRSHVRAIDWPEGVATSVNGRSMAAPAEAAWKLALAQPSGNVLPWGTIHSAKGREYPAVALVIPETLRKGEDKKSVLDHWQDDLPSEPRRVLYVGASRAQKLIMLACHSRHTTRIKKILAESNLFAHEIGAGACASSEILPGLS